MRFVLVEIDFKTILESVPSKIKHILAQKSVSVQRIHVRPIKIRVVRKDEEEIFSMKSRCFHHVCDSRKLEFNETFLRPN